MLFYQHLFKWYGNFNEITQTLSFSFRWIKKQNISLKHAYPSGAPEFTPDF